MYWIAIILKREDRERSVSYIFAFDNRLTCELSIKPQWTQQQNMLEIMKVCYIRTEHDELVQLHSFRLESISKYLAQK